MLAGAEAQEGGDVAGVIEIVVIFQIEQLDIAADGDGDDGIADVGQFAGAVSAGYAKLDEVGVEMTAVRALYGFGGIIFA
jgi:hypothetical protein